MASWCFQAFYPQCLFVFCVYIHISSRYYAAANLQFFSDPVSSSCNFCSQSFVLILSQIRPTTPSCHWKKRIGAGDTSFNLYTLLRGRLSSNSFWKMKMKMKNEWPQTKWQRKQLEHWLIQAAKRGECTFRLTPKSFRSVVALSSQIQVKPAMKIKTDKREISCKEPYVNLNLIC